VSRPSSRCINRRQLVCAGLAASSLTLNGCGALYRESPITMPQVFDDQACANTQAPVLLVLLPGAHMAPEELLREGFVQAVRQRKLAVDVRIADAHLGYVYDGSMLRRLHQDVVAPAQAQGYKRIWLAGISLGGYVAMGYAQQYPGQVEGLFAIAPYLGRHPVVQAVANAGGAAQWRQTAQPRDGKDHDHALWMWLSQPGVHTAASAAMPPLYLGYGTEDRFAQGHALLATLLPSPRVATAPGGHDWPPWRALWAQWLDRGLLPSRCGPGA
jgi:pimeloyl-ACP methyl ester carboxylesterase